MAEIGQSDQMKNIMIGQTRGYLCRLSFTYTHTGADAQGEIPLVLLPAGNFRLTPVSCRFYTSAMAAGSRVSIGHRAYHKANGELVTANPTKWKNQNANGTTPRSNVAFDGEPEDFNSRSGILLEATIGGGNIRTGDTIQGWVDLVRT